MTFYRVFTAISGLLVRAIFRPEVRGREQLPAGGFVLCANRLSGFDSFAVARALGARPARCMAKNELFATPVLGRFVRLLGAFPAHGPGGVARAASLAAAGDVVVVFPEGARRRGRQLRPRTGAARIAIGAGVPLVPVALRGTDDWRRLERWRIAIGAPIAVNGLEPAEATERRWDAVGRLEARLGATPAPAVKLVPAAQAGDR